MPVPVCSFQRQVSAIADGIGGNRGRQIVPGDEIGHDRLPCRHGHGADGTDQKCEHEQVGRGRPAQANNQRINRAYDRRDDFNHDQKSALVENVGKRAGRNCQQTDRQTARRLHQRHHQRIGIEQGHQPAGSRAVHPAADIGNERRRPDDGKRRMPERRRERNRAFRPIGGAAAHQPGLCASQRPFSDAAKSSASAALTASGSSLVMV